MGGTEWGCPPAPRLQPTTCQASDSLRHRCGDHSHHNAPRVQGGVGSSEWGPTCFSIDDHSSVHAPVFMRPFRAFDDGIIALHEEPRLQIGPFSVW